MATPPASSGSLKLSRNYKGLPIWAWTLGGSVLAAGGYVFVSRYRKAKTNTAIAAASTANNSTQGPTRDYPLVIPLPGPPGAVSTVAGPKGDTGAVGAPGAPGAPAPVPSPVPAPPPVQTPPAPAPPPPPPEPAPIPTYQVQRGDSLWRIAQQFYGNGALWPKIYAWNRDIIGPNPNLIQPGWELGVPP